ncbi:MAG: bifunctional diaminohydroxyphosphoribosylaminopyrimidine deaminase/5-amino-6-(5-phosphoribosylamino)uracil reductase RibD [Breznakibacter sp.]
MRTSDEQYMARCLQLAEMAAGHTYPNPMVGAVVVYNGTIIGEGYHCKAGEPHAEVNAIESVKDASLLSASTLYVNLEPCAHFGRTPPCSLLVIKKNIKKVVVGCVDTYSEVAGKGIEMMRHHGIEVVTDVLAQESRHLNRRFFTFHEKKRPYVILKWAQTLDGFIDIDRQKHQLGHPTWITNDYARRAVHKLRAREQAIMVGTRTAQNDNPSLTVRDWAGNQPLRIALDRTDKLPAHLNIFDGKVPTLIVGETDENRMLPVERLVLPFDRRLLPELLHHLHECQIQSLIVEGGRMLLQSLIDLGVWDEALVFEGNVRFGNGVAAPSLGNRSAAVTYFGDSRMFTYHNNG